jgi:sensor histidine kinase YesM
MSTKQSYLLRIIKRRMDPGLYYYIIYFVQIIVIFLLLITKLAIFSTRYGTWGICFVYGTLYAIKGLIAAGRNYENSICIRKACRFLLSTQLKTGGWGESFLSCERQVKSSFQFT